jgi:hypothetical protein
MPANQRQCEFFLLRYMPDARRGEFVNIGVVVREKEGGAQAMARMAPDWRRVRCLDPDADVELLESLIEDIERRMTQAEGPALLKMMEETFSSSLQFTRAQAVLATSVEEGVARLAQIYLERPATETIPRATGGRAAVFQQMRSAFECAGVWTLPQMRHSIAVAQYTRSGDPLKLDCGYQPNGVVKLFHAVALQVDTNLAKVLAYSFPQVREGIARTQKIEAKLTAVVESELDRSDEAIGFAIETLSAANVQIASVAEMDALAEQARQELRA